MKKILLTMAVIGMAAFHSFEQTTTSNDGGKFSISVDDGLPVGSVSDYSNFAIGDDLKYSLSAATNFDVSLSAGNDPMLNRLGQNIIITGKSI